MDSAATVHAYAQELRRPNRPDMNHEKEIPYKNTWAEAEWPFA